MKKLFVSQPMRGRNDDEILAERNRIILEAQETLGEAVDPLPSFFEKYVVEGARTPVRYLANAIAMLSDADVAVFGKGWEDARGCRIEHQVCIDYGIDIICLDRGFDIGESDSD